MLLFLLPGKRLSWGPSLAGRDEEAHLRQEPLTTRTQPGYCHLWPTATENKAYAVRWSGKLSQEQEASLAWIPPHPPGKSSRTQGLKSHVLFWVRGHKDEKAVLSSG